MEWRLLQIITCDSTFALVCSRWPAYCTGCSAGVLFLPSRVSSAQGSDVLLFRSKMGTASSSNASDIGANAYVFADAALQVMRMSPHQWSTTLSGQVVSKKLHAATFASSLSAQSFSHVYMTPSQHETVLKLQHFIASHVLPVENVLAKPSPVSLPVFDSLRDKARQQGLWNMFLQYTNTEYEFRPAL